MKRFSNSLYKFACMLLIFVGCTTTEETNTNIPGEIEVAWQQFIEAWETEDATTCASFYHVNALNIPNNFQENIGRDAIEAFYVSLFEANRSSKYTHKTESVSFSGNLAVEHANFTVDWVTNDGEEWTYRARTLVHWEKDENETWKIKTLLFNQPEPEQG